MCPVPIGAVNKILVIRLDRVGDLILSTPFFHNLRKFFPDAAVTAVVRPYTGEVLKNNPNVDELLIYDPQAPFTERMSFIDRLRKSGFDLAVSLSPISSSYLMTFLSKARIRCSYVYSDRFFNRLLTKLILTHCPVIDVAGMLKRDGFVPHEVRQTFSIFESLGFTAEETPLELFVSSGKPFAAGKNIGIHLSQKWFTAPWVYDDFRSLVENILSSFKDFNVIITYGDAEAELVDKVGLKNERVIFKGGMSFPDWAGEIGKNELFITTDTGSLHCAAAQGVKVVAVYEDSTFLHCSSQWAPWMVENEIVRKKESAPSIEEILTKSAKLLDLQL